MTIKFNLTKAGLIAITTFVGGAVGTAVGIILGNSSLGTEVGSLVGLITGVAVDIEQNALADSNATPVPTS